MAHSFAQVDVFTLGPLTGNPLAVVLGADDVDDETMARFASWTNLSETTFVTAPTDPAADYAVRIFTPRGELPFAGHPTLGSAHAWRAAGGVPRGERIVQECGVGLLEIDECAGSSAFAAPPLLRSGPVDEALLAVLVEALGVRSEDVVDSAWTDNGPGWVSLLLDSAATVNRVRPDLAALARAEAKVGVIGPYPAGSEADFEVRAFAPGIGVDEDPVTGSLNAGLATWLRAAGLAPERYVVSQGTALGRRGRVSVRDDGSRIWVGGRSTTIISGQVELT